MRHQGALAAAVAGLAVLVPVAVGQEPTTPERPATQPAAQIDIEIAIDTTGSMGPSIAQARRDAVEIVRDTRRRLPGARFAVVEFKDSTDEPEYIVRQAMSGDPKAIEDAIEKLRASGGDDLPEAYNLVFSRAVDDPAIGFRPGSRRILFVIGDAEPHGAKFGELPGCEDDSADPHGLRTHDVLSLVRRARITGNFILQASSASTKLECYRSMAGLTYGGGEAIRSGRTRRGRGGSAGLGDLIERAIAAGLPSVRTPSVATRPGAATRFSLSVDNRVPEDVRLVEMRVDLPEGVRYRPGSTRGLTSADPEVEGSRLTWTLRRTVPAQRRRDFVIGVRAPGEAGDLDAPVQATFEMPDRGLLRARGTVELEVRGEGR